MDIELVSCCFIFRDNCQYQYFLGTKVPQNFLQRCVSLGFFSVWCFYFNYVFGFFLKQFHKIGLLTSSEFVLFSLLSLEKALNEEEEEEELLSEDEHHDVLGFKSSSNSDRSVQIHPFRFPPALHWKQVELKGF